MATSDEKTLDQVQSLLSAISAGTAMLEHADHSTKIDPFEFIDSGELTLSRLICWCLNPAASHGEGDKFLRLFFDTFEIDCEMEFEAVKAQCEVRTFKNRSIDIVVDCGKFILAIENKPYASFGLEQLPHYHAHLSKTGKPFVLVALKGWVGSIPHEQVVANVTDEARLLDTDYRVLIRWLDACKGEARGNELKSFVRQMRDHIATHVVGESDMETQNILLSLVRDDIKQMNAALVIRDGSRALENELHERLAKAIASRVPRGWTVSTKPYERAGKMSSACHYLTIDFADHLPVVFVLEIASHGNAALIGVCRRRETKLSERRAKTIWEVLDKEIFVAEGGYLDWLWWAPQQTFVDHGRLDKSYDHIWRAMIEPDSLADAMVALAANVHHLVDGATRPE